VVFLKVPHCIASKEYTRKWTKNERTIVKILYTYVKAYT